MSASAAADPSPPSGAPAAPDSVVPARRLPALVHGGADVGGYYGARALGALFPLVAGLMVYGWRAMLVVAVVLMAAFAALLVWRRVGTRGPSIRLAHGMWLALVLALMLPASFDRGDPSRVPWALAAAGGAFVVIFLWLLGGVGAARVHPALVTFLLLVGLFYNMLIPHWVLHRGRAFVGDLWSAGPAGADPFAGGEPWVLRPRQPAGGPDAYWTEPAAQRLILYTSGEARAGGDVLMLPGLIRDQLPPLEDLVVGGHPGPIGASSAIAVIIGGLFLLYRGVIDWRVPLVICLSAYAALLVLPVPVTITDVGPHFLWLPLRDPRVQWITAVTFAHYELMASPLLFMAFFLATAPTARPMTRRGRVVYAMLIGLGSAAAQLYLSVSFGPYVVLLVVAALLTPLLDRLFRPKPLV
jgi:Na+-translocating ferredoxin:NAD+ oxidoreductase RnfD subunit